jgi:hypothetical protein
LLFLPARGRNLSPVPAAAYRAQGMGFLFSQRYVLPRTSNLGLCGFPSTFGGFVGLLVQFGYYLDSLFISVKMLND